jgi:hypothetical protein
MTTNNIIDSAVIFHDDLNPLLWDNNELKPIVRYKLLQISKHFIDFINIPELNLVDITISGSNASYTYTKNSDIDLHLVVDIPDNDKDNMAQLFNSKKNEYNFIHNIKIKGIDVELYVQDSDETHISAGIYSVLDNTWIDEPKSIKVQINDIDVTNKVKNYLDKIQKGLETNDIEVVNKISKRLSSLRKTGLEREGEFSVENIAYKILRNQGYLDKIRNHRYNLEDTQLSLENTMQEATEVGKVSQATASDVTVDNPDGTKTVVPVKSGMLSKDDKGNLVLNKAAALATSSSTSSSTPQQQPIKPGQQVQINNSKDELSMIKKNAGL